MAVTVSALLRCRKTGQEKRYVHEWPGSGLRGAASVLYLWTEGNYSCDCNRLRFLFGRDLDDTPPCYGGEPTIELVELVVDGERLEL